MIRIVTFFHLRILFVHVNESCLKLFSGNSFTCRDVSSLCHGVFLLLTLVWFESFVFEFGSSLGLVLKIVGVIVIGWNTNPFFFISPKYFVNLLPEIKGRLAFANFSVGCSTWNRTFHIWSLQISPSSDVFLQSKELIVIYAL